MRTIFADACYWIALLNPRDQLHQKANETSKNLGRCRIVTSEMVLTEFLNGLGKKGSQIREKAIKVVKTIMSSPNVEVIPQSSQQFRNAIEKYDNHRDKEWGLTDCASIQIMEERTINEILTNDHHFQQAGYTALMR